MLKNSLLSKMEDEKLKKIRLISGILFVIVYGFIFVTLSLGKIDLMEYNRVLLSFDTKVFTNFLVSMEVQGGYFYFQLGHIFDIGIIFIYALFFLSWTELSKRTSKPDKKHWKAAVLFSWLIFLIPFIDLFETGMMHAAFLTLPNVPEFVIYCHLIGKLIGVILYYPMLGWFFYLAVRAIKGKIRLRKAKKVNA